MPRLTADTPPAAAPAPAWWLLGLALLFCLSGASALIYQVLWLRLLGLVFGVTVYAASTVWASFMGGLAVGSVIAGRVADRVRRPLVWFAAAEVGIALSAAVTPFLLGHLVDTYPSLLLLLGTRFFALTVIRLGIAFAVLLVPTALMGATLPLVLKSSTIESARLGPSASLLYGTNTLGAIAGTLAAGFYLIPYLGMATTFRIAGLANLTVAAGAWLLSKRTAPLQATGGPTGSLEGPASGMPAPLGLGARRLVLLTFTVSGAASLAFEVVWLRVILVIAGPTVYTISMVLATVLAGISLGSYAIMPLVGRRTRLLGWLVAAELGIVVTGILSMAVVPRLPDLVRDVPPILAHLFPDYLVPVLASSVLVALPTSLLLGLAFPLGLQLWTLTGDDPANARAASRIGVFYALNVCGAIVGSLVAGFILLPHVGSRATLIVVCAAVLLSALALLAALPVRRGVRVVLGATALAAFLASAIALPEPMGPLLIARHPGQPVDWLEEGVQSTVSIQRLGPRRVMYIDGAHQADDTGSMTLVHYRIGTVPFALHPDPHRAMVVGLGGGATAGAASADNRVQLDVVELSPGVVHTAPYFKNISFDLLNKPSVRLTVDDARTQLALAEGRYDIITADTILPTRAGAASLYSAEYFRLVRNALSENGIALQWFSGTDAEYKLVARTFLSVFPDTTVWAADGSLLIGTKRKSHLVLRREDFARKLEYPPLAEALKRVGLNRYEDLVALFRAGPDDLRRFVGEGPILTDDKPVLEYFLSLPRDNFDPSGLVGDVRPYLEP